MTATLSPSSNFTAVEEEGSCTTATSTETAGETVIKDRAAEFEHSAAAERLCGLKRIDLI